MKMDLEVCARDRLFTINVPQKSLNDNSTGHVSCVREMKQGSLCLLDFI